MFLRFNLYNIKKEFLILIKSNLFLFLLLSIFVYVFFYYFVFNVKVKIYLQADQKIKKTISAFLINKNENIVFIEDLSKSDLSLIINSSAKIWEVNIKVNNFFAIKLIPVINYLLFKVYFSFYNQIEPINFYIDLPNNYISMDNFKIDSIFVMIKNFIIWTLFSYLFFDIYSEKKNKTILIYLVTNNLFNFIFSKIIVLVMVLVFILIIFNSFIKADLNAAYSLAIILNFILISFVLAILALVIQNKYYINLVNMFLGLFTILFSIFNQSKLIYFFVVFSSNYLVFNINYIKLALFYTVFVSLVILFFYILRNFILLKILKEVD
jgi:hypothetical protein